MGEFARLKIDMFNAQFREKELLDEIEELRSERQREHALRVQIAGSLESVQEQHEQMIAELQSLPRLDYVMYNDGYTAPYPAMEEDPHGEYCAHGGIQRIIDKYRVKHE